MATDDRHFTHSTLRERIVEHVFVGDVLRTLWRRGVTDVEILRSEFDAHGYDVVMSRGAVVRHIQFKTQKDRDIKVSLALAEKPSGCVVWIGIDEHLNLKHSVGLAGYRDNPCLKSRISQRRGGRPATKLGNVPTDAIIAWCQSGLLKWSIR